MVGAEQVLATVDRIYHAALEPVQWPSVLTEIADLTGSIGGVLIFQNKRCPQDSRVLIGRIDQEAADLYVQRYMGASDNPWTPVTEVQPRGVLRVSEVVPTAVLVRTAFYDEVERPQHILHQISAVMDCDDVHSNRLSVCRSPAAGPGEDADVCLLAWLLPHVRRAALVAARLERGTVEAGAALGTLDRLTHGVVLLDDRGHVLHVNAAAEAVLAAGDGLCCRDGRLSALLPFQGAALDAAIAAGAGGPLPISRRAGGHPYVVVVAPAGEPSRWPLASAPATLLLITDLDARVDDAAALRALYGLTRAEAAVAAEIAAGRGLPAAARHLGISPNTAHAYLTSVFRKTGLRSQSALAAAFARLAQIR
jgi:DNA-binding CsgD family transcriptional regulator